MEPFSLARFAASRLERSRAGGLLPPARAGYRDSQPGYASEFAFAKAFKRDYGIAPGSYRRRLAA
jgi:hypothetical protein